ncbi:MAG TPA: tetratricopeptide repeat protein [Pirellulales bacterium]|nr:tetratricopeptide repeat protein [Pirellulales bacterium]
MAFIVAATLVAYWPSLSGGFILDDDLLLTDNPLIKAPDGIFQFWYSTNQPDYVPLTSSTLWLEWRLWGMHPTGYHITNLVLHIIACLSIWQLLRQLSIPGAFFAALLFAVHPVNVESVAWVEQRKNTLSLVLFLLSLLWYLVSEQSAEPADQEGRPGVNRWYWLSLLSFALAMCSKGSVAILPLVLLLIVWWQRGRITKQDLLRSAPFFLLAAAITPIIIWFVTHGSGAAVRHVTFLQRLLGAGAAIWFYLFKALLPTHLLFVYPNWNIEPADPLWWLPSAAALIVTALLWWRRNSRLGRPLFFAWTFYCIALLPVLGFTDSGYARFSLVADHYQYIALIAVTSLAAASCTTWLNHAHSSTGRFAPMATASLITGCLMLLTWRQSRLYDSPISLYEAALAENSNSWMLHYNLGIPLIKVGHLQDAIGHFQRALQLNPDYPEAYLNLGIALAGEGKIAEATDHFQHALQIKPDYAEAHYNLANILAQTGHLPEAIEHYQEAVRLKSDFAEAHNNLSTALYQTGDMLEAMHQDKQALQIKPDYAEAMSNLANCLLQLGYLEEAGEYYRQALALSPDFYDAHFNLGLVLLKTRRPQEAIKHFEQALHSNPDDLDVCTNLINAYALANRPQDAISTALKSIVLARAHGQAALAQQIEAALEQYRAQQAAKQNFSPAGRIP